MSDQQYPDPYVQFLCHFHGDRDYFTCHEILEEYWKSLPPPRERIWVGLIQIAVALYHHRRGNMAGAGKLLKHAIPIIAAGREQVTRLGLDSTALLRMLQERLAQIQNNAAYTSINLPIADLTLQAACEQRCASQDMRFGTPSRLDDPYLLHKHTLRDRSGVIRERLERLHQKQISRSNSKTVRPRD